ncbi:MAG: TonB family protein, partial [bacterium]|nr:TonB family protein [bacterium]
HGLLVAAIVIVPLMQAQSGFPQVKIQTVLAVSPPMVPPPPMSAKKKRTSTKGDSKRKDSPKPKPRPVDNKLIQPLFISEEIEEEDLADFGGDSGDDYGVIGGSDFGDIDGVLGGIDNGKNSSSNPIVRVSQFERPRLLKQVAPLYPEHALRAHINGVVIVEASTDIYGRVIRVNIINGHPLLKASAITAIRQWVYEPYIINGVPRPVIFTVTVNFRLTNG